VKVVEVIETETKMEKEVIIEYMSEKNGIIKYQVKRFLKKYSE